MRNQSIRLFLYSSLAIVGLALAWGFKNIPQQRNLAELTLKNSLEQELITLSSAVHASTQALRFKLLDILKAEGNERPTRAFQDSSFTAVSLVEWDENFWKPLWHASKSKAGFQISDFKEWVKSWPISKINSGDVYFTKVNDDAGQAHFAIVVPVRKPSGKPMVGVGVFPANQFGLSFAADRTREIQVFDDLGFAVALSRPAYLGASLKTDPLVQQILEGGEISARSEWQMDDGNEVVGVATRMSDSNLSVAVEAPLNFGTTWIWKSWLYLAFCAFAAVGLNWYILNSLVQPLLNQVSQSDLRIEQLKRAHAEAPAQPAERPLPTPELEEYSFIETSSEDLPKASSAPTPKVSLGKVVGSALRSLESRLKENNIRVQQTGLEDVIMSGDALQLQTALEEVIKNSIEAMNEGGDQNWLVVKADRRGDNAILSIEDTGSGVSDENLNKVFDPFFSTKDTQGVARGLGLNVVRRVLEEMGGSVSLKRRQGEPGTLVELQWPLEKVAAVDEKSPSRSAHTPSVSASAAAAKQAMSELEAFDLTEEDDFSTLIMQAPLIPTALSKRSAHGDLPIRKPVVRPVDSQ